MISENQSRKNTASDTADELDFTGQVLIAMPGMEDTRFANSVVLMCEHSDQGAMGLIINKSIDGLKLTDLFEQLSISTHQSDAPSALHFGGPVETGRGFVLHSSEYTSGQSHMRVGADFALTVTQDVLEDMAEGRGPQKALTMLGYSGWGPGQLEREIGENGWLVAEAAPDLVFDAPDADKWAHALKSLGVDALTLSSAAGHA